MQNKLIPDKPKDTNFPSNLKHEQEADMVRIPIIEKFREIDGELYYQIRGDDTFRKWDEYNHMNFNRKE